MQAEPEDASNGRDPKEKPSRAELNRAEFARYKADVKTRGKPFYPYAMFHDTIMSLVVVLHDHRARGDLEVVGVRPAPQLRRLGAARPVHGRSPADPGTTSFVPRPDWYFYFLFYLLRIFKWPESVFLGTVGVPTIALVLLIVLPFMDRRPRAQAVAAAGRDGRRRAHDPLDGRPDVEGRDGEGGARVRGQGRTSRAGSRRRTCRRRRFPVRTSSRSRAAPPAIRTTASGGS